MKCIITTKNPITKVTMGRENLIDFTSLNAIKLLTNCGSPNTPIPINIQKEIIYPIFKSKFDGKNKSSLRFNRAILKRLLIPPPKSTNLENNSTDATIIKMPCIKSIYAIILNPPKQTYKKTNREKK